MGELTATLSSRELTEWMCFAEIEPWGGAREDDRARLTAALIYGANRGKTSPTLGPGDFLKTPAMMRRAIETQDERLAARRVQVAAAVAAEIARVKGG